MDHKNWERFRGAVTLSLHCLSSRPAEYSERVPLGVWLFQWEKESSRWTSNFQALLDDFWESQFSLTSQGSLRKPVKPDHRESAREEKGVRLTATSVWIMADCFPIDNGSHAESPAIYRTKPVDPSGQGARLAVYLVWVFGQQAFPWDPSYDFSWRGWQASNPVQLLITGSSPAQTGSLAKDRRQLWSPSYGTLREISQQPRPNVEHSLQPLLNWEPKQQFQATSEHSPQFQTCRKRSQHPCLIANKTHTNQANKQINSIA